MMSPEKKVLQMELAQQILTAEITGRRANGQAGGMNYFSLFEDAVTQAVDIVDLIEKEVTNNAILWQSQNQLQDDSEDDSFGIAELGDDEQ
jgi:hypothetical protein